MMADDMDFIDATPEQFNAVRRAELAKWKQIVKQTGIQAE